MLTAASNAAGSNTGASSAANSSTTGLAARAKPATAAVAMGLCHAISMKETISLRAVVAMSPTGMFSEVVAPSDRHAMLTTSKTTCAMIDQGSRSSNYMHTNAKKGTRGRVPLLCKGLHAAAGEWARRHCHAVVILRGVCTQRCYIKNVTARSRVLCTKKHA